MSKFTAKSDTSRPFISERERQQNEGATDQSNEDDTGSLDSSSQLTPRAWAALSAVLRQVGIASQSAEDFRAYERRTEG